MVQLLCDMCTFFAKCPGKCNSVCVWMCVFSVHPLLLPPSWKKEQQTKTDSHLLIWIITWMVHRTDESTIYIQKELSYVTKRHKKSFVYIYMNDNQGDLLTYTHTWPRATWSRWLSDENRNCLCSDQLVLSSKWLFTVKKCKVTMFSIYLHYCFFQPFVFYPNKCINFVMFINMLHLLYFHNVNNDHVKGAHIITCQ